ncbi:FkbM family methyltransferase [Larkinella bovis]|uniref:FkbM family methyltransferase n=1 Tax=Larkinella bovis TaxID=683041 RepID=A0ABW0IFI6_9BACT
MTRFLKWLLAPIRVTWLQPLYEKLYLFTLYAMNYGGGSYTEDSGEQFVLAYVARKTERQSKPIVIFDVGANVGSYAQLVLKTFESRATVHCFEPSHSTYQTLVAAVTAPTVIKHPFGLSSKTGQLPLYADAEQSGMMSVYSRDLQHLNISFGPMEVATFSTVDAFCREQNIPEISLLKIDVEGHEFSVLEGAQQLLKDQRIRFIQFEFGGTNIDSRTFFRDFWKLLHDDFILYRIVGNGLRRIDAYSELLEIFVAVNYFAERKSNPV